MAQGNQSEGGLISELLALAILPVLGLSFSLGWPFGFIVFIMFFGAILYREFQLSKAAKESGKVQTQFNQVGYEKRDVAPSQESEIEELATIGAFATIIAYGCAIIGILLVILLVIYIFFTPALWFFCSMAEGQSCGVEVVFWPIFWFF